MSCVVSRRLQLHTFYEFGADSASEVKMRAARRSVIAEGKNIGVETPVRDGINAIGISRILQGRKFRPMRVIWLD